MDNQLKERDFIDLIGSLYTGRYIFYVILIFFMSIGVVFTSFYNNEFKFTFEIKTPYKRSYLEFSNYLNYIDGVVVNNQYKVKTDYKDYVSIRSSFRHVENFIFDPSNIDQLADLFLNSPYYDNSDGKTVLINKIRSAIYVEKIDGIRFYVSSDNKGLVNFLHTALPSFLNDSIGSKYIKYILRVKNAKVSELQLMKNIRTDLLKKQLIIINENINIAQSNISINGEELAKTPNSELDILNREKWEISKELSLIDYYERIIDSKILPKKDKEYYYILSSDISDGHKINSLFVFLFLLFVSILFHLIVVITIDLKEQVITRLESRA